VPTPNAKKHGETGAHKHAKREAVKQNTTQLQKILGGSDIGVYPIRERKQQNSYYAGRNAQRSVPLRVEIPRYPFPRPIGDDDANCRPDNEYGQELYYIRQPQVMRVHMIDTQRS
jgi:hypothetical protein